MAQISAARVKELRERTGAGMMDCKKVLVEAGGDLSRAMDLLRKRGIVKARGKAGRATSEGLIAASVANDSRSAALVEVNCETDFVAKTDEFVELAQELARLVRDGNPADVDALLAQSARNGSTNDRILEAIARLGENIQARRIARLEAGEGGWIGSYIHAGGKIGALVQLEADDSLRPAVAQLARNLCMHVTATSPLGVSREDLPGGEVEKERSALRHQSEQEGKPANVVEKMVEGRLRKFFKEVVLLEQPLVMDPDQIVEVAAEAAGARVVAFRRFQLGEEIGG